MWVRKKSRWSPWTASKTQGSLVIATLLDIQCFRRPARGRWLMTVRIQCKIIPGNRPSFWVAGGACCRPLLAPLRWILNERWNWLTGTTPTVPSSFERGDAASQNLSSLGAVHHRSSLKQNFCCLWSGLNCGLGPSPKKVFVSLRKFLWGKRWQSSLWIGVV